MSDYASATITPEDMPSKAVPQTETPQQPDVKAERPSWLPEKFKSPEDLAKSYAELEKKLGGAPKKAEEPPKEQPKKGEELKITPKEETKQDAEATLQEVGLKMDEFEAEFTEKGALSEESYGKLEAKGIPKAMVDAYIAGQQALAQQQTDMLLTETIGGRDVFQKAVEWAAVNMDPQDVAEYNEAVKSKNPTAIKLALKNLKVAYEGSMGNPPKLLQGDRSAASVDTYESKAQLVEDMRNPMYKKDPAFRAKVEAKLARSNIL